MLPENCRWRDPRFADARNTFLGNLKAHGQASAQKAMLQAMAAGG